MLKLLKTNNKSEISSTDEFDKIWNDVIIVISKSIAESFDLKLKNERFFRFRMRRLYKSYRKSFLKSYMYSNARKIDKHKVAACLVKALLVVKPLSISLMDRLRIRFSSRKYKHSSCIEEVVLANQYLSLSVAVTVIEGYIQAHSDNNDKAQPLKHKIIFPTPFSPRDKAYIRDVCLDLYYTKARRFNTITYANVFFLWEKYSCRRVQCENVIEALKKALKSPNEYDFSNEDDSKIEEFVNSIRYSQCSDGC